MLPRGYFRGKIVKFVDDKGYGFVRHPDGRDIFIHLADGRIIIPGIDYPAFAERVRHDIAVDVEILFKVTGTGRHTKAVPWGLADDWDESLEVIRKRTKAVHHNA